MYVGLFYNYYRVVHMSNDPNPSNRPYDKEDYIITPWFFSLEYAKEKAGF